MSGTPDEVLAKKNELYKLYKAVLQPAKLDGKHDVVRRVMVGVMLRNNWKAKYMLPVVCKLWKEKVGKPDHSAMTQNTDVMCKILHKVLYVSPSMDQKIDLQNVRMVGGFMKRLNGSISKSRCIAALSCKVWCRESSIVAPKIFRKDHQHSSTYNQIIVPLMLRYTSGAILHTIKTVHHPTRTIGRFAHPTQHVKQSLDYLNQTDVKEKDIRCGPFFVPLLNLSTDPSSNEIKKEIQAIYKRLEDEFLGNINLQYVNSTCFYKKHHRQVCFLDSECHNSVLNLWVTQNYMIRSVYHLLAEIHVSKLPKAGKWVARVYITYTLV